MKKLSLAQKDSIAQKLINQILFSGIITLLLFVVMYSITYVTYTTTDDVFLMKALAGYFNAEPTGWTLFLNPIVCRFISFLYVLFPAQPCYAYLQIALMFFSITAINACIIRKSIQGGRKIIFAVLIIVLLFASTFSWMLVRMHFYYVAILAGTAAVAILLTASFAEKNNIGALAAIAFFVFVCEQYSTEAGYSVLCFVALAILLRALLSVKRNDCKKVILNLAICASAIAIVCIGCLKIYTSVRLAVNGEEYVEWNQYRLSYWDYPVDSYQENPELYDSVGWSEEFYELTRKMYFMDEKFSTESLSHIVNKFNRTNIGTKDRTLRDVLITGRALFRSSGAAKGALISAIGVFVASIALFRKERKQLLYIFAAMCSAGGSFILSAYLCYRARFPLRAFSAISVPCIVFLTVVFIDLIANLGTEDNDGKKVLGKTLRARLTSLLLAAAFIIAIYPVKNYLFDKNVEAAYAESHSKEIALYDYVKNHKENIYIYDANVLSTYYPFHTLRRGDLSNLFAWGGARLYTAFYYDQLKMNGRDTLYSDAFMDENVYFLSRSNNNIQLLFRYLENEFGAQTYTVIEQLDNGYMVCKFSDDADS